MVHLSKRGLWKTGIFVSSWCVKVKSTFRRKIENIIRKSRDSVVVPSSEERRLELSSWQLPFGTIRESIYYYFLQVFVRYFVSSTSVFSCNFLTNNKVCWFEKWVLKEYFHWKGKTANLIFYNDQIIKLFHIIIIKIRVFIVIKITFRNNKTSKTEVGPEM